MKREKGRGWKQKMLMKITSSKLPFLARFNMQKEKNLQKKRENQKIWKTNGDMQKQGCQICRRAS